MKLSNAFDSGQTSQPHSSIQSHLSCFPSSHLISLHSIAFDVEKTRRVKNESPWFRCISAIAAYRCTILPLFSTPEITKLQKEKFVFYNHARKKCVLVFFLWLQCQIIRLKNLLSILSRAVNLNMYHHSLPGRWRTPAQDWGVCPGQCCFLLALEGCIGFSLTV